jgi:alanine or glycine:cation symporter, AGCS family
MVRSSPPSPSSLEWSYYGEKSIEYLLGEKAVKPYRDLFVICAGFGAVMKLELAWALADIFNGLMAFPNLIGLLALSPIIVSETREYFQNKSNGPTLEPVPEVK